MHPVLFIAAPAVVVIAWLAAKRGPSPTPPPAPASSARVDGPSPSRVGLPLGRPLDGSTQTYSYPDQMPILASRESHKPPAVLFEATGSRPPPQLTPLTLGRWL